VEWLIPIETLALGNIFQDNFTKDSFQVTMDRDEFGSFLYNTFGGRPTVFNKKLKK